MELADFYKAIGFFRASGLSEAQAYHRAEEAMMTTFNVTILRRSAMTISFQTDSYNEAVRKSLGLGELMSKYDVRPPIEIE